MNVCLLNCLIRHQINLRKNSINNTAECYDSLHNVDLLISSIMQGFGYMISVRSMQEESLIVEYTLYTID